MSGLHQMKQSCCNPPHIYTQTSLYKTSLAFLQNNIPPVHPPLVRPPAAAKQSVFKWSTRDLVGGGLQMSVENRTSFPALVKLNQNKFSSSKHDLILLDFQRNDVGGQEWGKVVVVLERVF